MEFAESLTRIVIEKKCEQRERHVVAAAWKDREAKLVDAAVKLLKQRCQREAQQQRCELTVSFEVLSRDIDGFPTHTFSDNSYIVGVWGEGITAESWHYASRGPNVAFRPGQTILYAEMLEVMMPKFLAMTKELGFRLCGREAGTWKVSVVWNDPDALPPDFDPEASFADKLTQLVIDAKKEHGQRAKLAERWLAHEGKLLDKAVELFKERCMREAQQLRCNATVSFEVLSREIPGFPSRVLSDNTYLVDSWAEGTSAESWCYATRGPTASWSPGAPVLFAEVLEGMMPKFLERLHPLGFQGCRREAGTWKVTASWQQPEEDPQAGSNGRSRNGSSKKRKLPKGGSGE